MLKVNKMVMWWRTVQASEQMKRAYGRVIYSMSYQNEDIEAFVGSHTRERVWERDTLTGTVSAHDMITITQKSRSVRPPKTESG